MMELIGKLNAASEARREARKALEPLVEKILGMPVELARRNMFSWDYQWYGTRLQVNIYEQTGYMDSVTKLYKTQSFTRDELQAEPSVGGSSSFV